ncbi:MAG: GNAT family N-acetyltransferase [Bacteroidia bacterium]
MKSSQVIETKNLLLRGMGPDLHREVFTQLNDAQLKDFFGHETDEALAKERMMFEQGLTAYNKSFFLFHLIEKSSAKTIGWCGYHNIATKHDRAEIGYVINNEKYRGKGYMKEALIEVLKFGFEVLKFHRIEALTGKTNFISQKLLTDSGFKYEGLLREHYFINNVYEDSMMYSLMQQELVKQ